MDYYIGNTDYDWFNFLKNHNNPQQPEDINFWKPGGKRNFRAIKQGEPFLLKLKKEHSNKIAGVAFFSRFIKLPLDYAWDVFELQNGVDSYYAFRNKIEIYRLKNDIHNEECIGCIVLSNPIFFDEKNWVEPPKDWNGNIVTGKSYSCEDRIGKETWDKVLESINLTEGLDIYGGNDDNMPPAYNYCMQRTRIGQSAFRLNVAEAYSNKCAISGESALPTLQAAHIKPYSESGSNNLTTNGILLRSDLHRLYDKGYIAITEDYKVKVGQRLSTEFNSEYYKMYDGKELSMPSSIDDYPSKEFLVWHNEHYFMG